MWFNESGVLQFRAGFAATWSTSTVGTITVSKLKDIDSLQWLPSEGDRVIVKSKNRSVKTEKEPIFTWAGTVTSDGLPTGKDENGNAITDDQWRAKFDSPAIDVDDYATVNAAKEFDSGLTLNQTVYDANFDTGVLKYPDFMYLQIDNSSGTDKNVTKLVIEGKPVVENYLEVIYDAGSFNTEREVSNDLISSKVWASSLAKWLYENGNGKFEAVVPLADFSLGLGWKVGNKVEIVDASTGLSHRAWVRAIDIDYRNRDLTVTLRSDRDSEFEYTPPPGSITGPGTNIPYDPQFGDGVAPATPTGLSLSSFYKNGKSYVKADWNDNSEEDLLGYELRWNYDNGATWYNAGFTSQSELVIEVTGNGDTTYTVYAQVRARDNEKLQSGWSSSASITVQKDTSAPSAPGSISVVSGVGIIYVYWDRVSAIDLNYYQLERCVQTSNGGAFSAYAAIATLKSTDYIDENLDYHIQNDPEDEEYPNQWRKYKYRVKAVDLSGNGSSYRESSSSYASQATGADIAVNSVKANHLEATLDLSVGRKVVVGSNVQIGKSVGPTGLTGDGIYISKDAYFRINSGLFMDEGLWMGKSLGERIHPFMTSNTTPSGYEVSNNKGGSNAWYLFRESTSSVVNHYVNNWSQIKLPIRKILASYNIYSASSSNCATGWKIQGSNDGTNWTDLDTQSGVSAWTGWKATDFSVSSSGAYLYYRLKILAVTGSYAMITSIKLLDAEGWKFSVVASGSDPNFFAWDGQLNLKGNLILATDENVIEFEDSGIELGDGVPSSGENFIYFKRGRTGEYISWLSEYLIEAAERNSFGVLANEYVDATFSLNVMASDTVEANNKAYLKAELRNTSSANTMTALMEIIRLGSASTHGYFKFSHPINVLYPTSQDASDMPQGTILIQGNDLYFKDNSGASGAWKKVSASLASPS